MNKIDNYGSYLKNFYESDVKNRKAADAAAEKTLDQPNAVYEPSRANKAESSAVELSDAAKELLDKLKEKYSNMDFMVASYSSEEEAQALMARGTKEYSVLIDPQLLEQMAADEETANKYMGIIEESTSKLGEMKEQLAESGEEVTKIGFSVDKDGSVTYFAELERAGKERSAQIEESVKEKRAEKKKEAKEAEEERLEKQKKSASVEDKYQKPDSVKRTTVSAPTIEELLEKIKAVNWDEIEALPQKMSGARFDFTV